LKGERSHVLVHAIELLEPFLAREAHQRHAEGPDLSVEAHEFEMRRQLGA
jgi:hypothetical protein